MMDSFFKYIRKIIPRPLTSIIRFIWAKQFLFGIVPDDFAILSKEVIFSAKNKKWDTRKSKGIGGWFPVDNHSHGYHGLLKQWWDAYGLGEYCLLISETCKVKNNFLNLYPNTKVIATDFYVDLNPELGETDIVWNLYNSIPKKLSVKKFDSIICQATFEHIIDPVGVLRKLASLLTDGGYLYLHTHTPLYPYHACPRDYLRYFPDWFHDISLVIPSIKVIEVYCVEGHAFSVYQKIVKQPSTTATPIRP